VEFDWDEIKNKQNIATHGLDFADAQSFFDKPVFSWTDVRKDYKESRLVGIGELNDRVVVLVYTMRQGICRVISLRRANKNERRKYYSWIKNHEKQN
jgi:uncharacterized DUF497 family protein